jgi:putative pyoverdin transport system ATP-binding/permease protein
MRNLIVLLLKNSVLWPMFALMSSLVAGVSTTLTMVVLIRAIYGGGHQDRLLVFWMFIGINLVGRSTASLMVASVTRETVHRIRRQLIDRVIAAALADLEAIGTARIYNVVTNEAAQLGLALPVLVGLLSNLAFISGCFVYLAWISIEYFLMLITILALSTTAIMLINQKSKGLIVEARKVWEDIIEDCNLMVQGIKQLKLSRARQTLMRKRLTEHSHRSTAIWATHSLFANAAFVSSELAFYLAITAILVSPSFLPISHEVVVSYGLIIVYMWGPVREISRAIPTLATAEVARSQIESVGVALHEAAEPTGNEGELLQSRSVTPEWRSLFLTDVGYAYQSGDGFEFGLSNVTLELERGSVVFIVGGNGSGKTTLAKLICGLYSPNSGSLRVDDVVLDASYTDWWAHQCSAIFSDFVIFDEVSESVQARDREKDETLLRELHLDGRITIENMRFSRTKGLSSGERKRAALLSVLLEERPVVIFDEWAADQDPTFRNIFYCTILSALRQQGRLVIVISHDDRYFSMADKIVTLERGAAMRMVSKPQLDQEAVVEPADVG